MSYQTLNFKSTIAKICCQLCQVFTLFDDRWICYNNLGNKYFLRGDDDLSSYVRPMRKEDVTQVTEIDREAFSTQWPPPNYQHELQKRLTYYIVACDDGKTVDKPGVSAFAGKAGIASRLSQLFSYHRFFNNKLPLSSGHYVVGFAGFWILADEAHITSIAVREANRRRGIGELLIISGINLAMELKARIITLEVRASNVTARNLYTKYGFTQVGVRRGYYMDSREDGILMSTQDITFTVFQACLQQLKQAYARKWGVTINQIIR
ncbi:ribosomal protein S18-alanine N-acetyltransferase [Chloroflexota bacterium]